MLPRGAAPLIEMRKYGKRPSAPVFVSAGEFPDPAWHRYSDTMHHPELVIRGTDPLERLDFRCLIGLSVTLFLSNYGERAGQIYERLQEYATAIDVLSPDFGDDLGWFWTAKGGRQDYKFLGA